MKGFSGEKQVFLVHTLLTIIFIFENMSSCYARQGAFYEHINRQDDRWKRSREVPDIRDAEQIHRSLQGRVDSLSSKGKPKQPGDQQNGDGGPVINVAVATYNTYGNNNGQIENVQQLPTVPSHFLKSIQVVYSNDSVSRPSNVLPELNGKNADINSRFGGSFVWLVPVWTTNASEGATGIEIAIQSESNENYDDLAKGAGGKFRYIKMLHAPHLSKRITEICLYRSGNGNDNPKSNGWQYTTGDINAGRRKDFLWMGYNLKNI